MGKPNTGLGNQWLQLCSTVNRAQDNRAQGRDLALPHRYFKISALVRLLCRAQREPKPRIYGLARQRARE